MDLYSQIIQLQISQMKAIICWLKIFSPIEEPQKTATAQHYPPRKQKVSAKNNSTKQHIQQRAKQHRVPSDLALNFMQWVQQGLVSRELKYNEAGAAVHFVKEGMALVTPRIFKDYAAQEGGDANLTELATKVQRELIKCGWDLPGPNRTNIVRYAIQGLKTK